MSFEYNRSGLSNGIRLENYTDVKSMATSVAGSIKHNRHIFTDAKERWEA
jgi:hypothetical protein